MSFLFCSLRKATEEQPHSLGCGRGISKQNISVGRSMSVPPSLQVTTLEAVSLDSSKLSGMESSILKTRHIQFSFFLDLVRTFFRREVAIFNISNSKHRRFPMPGHTLVAERVNNCFSTWWRSIRTRGVKGDFLHLRAVNTSSVCTSD